MTTSFRAIAIALAAAVGLATPAVADGTPSNEELYQMILELQAGQQRLVDEANQARAEAQQAREQLAATEQELESARRELEAQTAAATPAVSAGPAVSAATTDEGTGFVREQAQPRGLAPWAEIHVLRATDNNLDFAVLTTEEAPVVGIGSNKVVQQKYDASYKVGARYSPGGAQDYAISFQSFENTEGASLSPPFEQPDGNAYTALIATLAPPGFGELAESATARSEFRYKSVDAEVGENLAVGESLDLRLFGGLRFTDMNEHFEAFYYGGDFPTLDEDGARANHDFGFWGVGPRVGAGGRVGLPWGFHLFGQAGVSILVGEQESEVQFQQPPEVETIAFVHRDYGVRVIPAVDMRAGLGWARALGEWGSVFIDGGYEFQNYFGAVEVLSFGPEEAPGAVGASSGDLGIDGFFFRGGFRFNGP
jgi:hypothetical protein